MKAVEYFKNCLMGHNSRSMENRDTKNYLNCQEFSQDVSEEKNFSMLPRDHSCGCLLPLSEESA